MIIYDNTGAVLLDIEVDDSSVRYKAIKGDNVLTLRFSLAEHTEFPVGCWCEFKGEVYYLMASSDIMMNHRRDFDYTLMMYAIEAKAKLYKFVNPVDGRLKFPLTAYPKEHLQMFVDNMNSREDEGNKTWKIGECIEHERITLSYNHTFCYDALVQLAEDLEMDFWFDGTTVSLGKLEINKDAPLPLSYGGDGEGLKPGIKRTNYSDALPIERLYVQGTEQNIDFSKYGSKELHLPKNMTIGYDGLHFEGEEGFDAVNARWYETDENGYSLKRSYTESKTLAEDSLDCSEIIPSKDEEVAQVIVVDEEKHFYDILFKSPVDYKTCQIAGETAYIVFQTGMLAGKELDLATNNDGVIICNKEGEYWRVEIAPQDIDGILMPDSSTGFIPQVGDTFKVFGVQLPSEYISDLTTRSGAEWDMFRYAVKHLYANEVPQYTIAGELDEIYAKRNWNSVKDKIVLGSYIAFSDRSIQEDALLIRIVGIKEYVNKPYSPRLKLSNQVIGGTLTGALNRIENQEVYNEELYRKGINFSKRRFRDAKEIISLLEKAVLDGFTETVSPIAVKTMSLLIGNESLQFRFVNSTESPERVDSTLRYDTLTKRVLSDAGIIQHMTLDIKQVSSDYSGNDYHFWNVSAFESEPMDADTSYYLYIKASTTSDEAEYILSDKAIGMRDVSGYYHFLTAILNKEFEGERSFVSLYGFTEVLPGQISTDMIRSADGNTYFDLANGKISGKIHFEAGSTGLNNVEGFSEALLGALGGIEVGGQNMLRNSGFTGDYLSEQLADDNVLDATSQMFNPPLVHWDAYNATVQDSTESASGKEVVFEDGGSISQTLYQRMIVGEHYVLSLKAKGEVFTYGVGGVRDEISLSDDWEKFVFDIVPTTSDNVFSLSNVTGTICDVQLERGTIPTAWSNNPLDNNSDRAYYEALKHLDNVLNAVTDATTTVSGGLVLTNQIHVGDYADKVMKRATGGISGTWSKDDDPFLWGGGNIGEANKAIETDGEEGANFVITHGGKAILNEAKVRGHITARSGEIGDFEIAEIDNGMFLKADGDRGNENVSMRLSGYGLQMHAEGGIGESGAPAYRSQSTSYPTREYASIIRNEFTDTGSDDSFMPAPCIALRVSAKGAKSNNNTQSGGNYAILIENGMIGGLRPATMSYAINTLNLTAQDHTVLFTRSTTVNLPSNPQDGQEYELLCPNTSLYDVIVVSSKKMYLFYDGDEKTSFSVRGLGGTRQVVKIVFFATDGKWFVWHHTY